MRAKTLLVKAAVRLLCGIGAAAGLAVGACAAPRDVRCAIPGPVASKPRILVLTDIGNEPDDAESLVRLLLYANDLDIEGLVATTSTWQRDKVQPALIEERVAAYARVLPILRRQASGWPDAAKLADVIRSGSARYGMAGVGDGHDTEGSRLIEAAVDQADARPLWISAWGGVADLAQALWHVRATRTPEQIAAFVAKLRVYAISDQDDAGPWIRRTFPDLFWIGSVHGWEEYSLAAWNGISGDLMRPQNWPDADMVSNAWLADHIRRGPLGSLYPPHSFIMEGDSPSFLYLIPNGLGVAEQPDYGSWGGRYASVYPGARQYADVADRYAITDGTVWRSNQATVFRWRGAFQRDFAARMAWTLPGDRTAINHAPVLTVNGQSGLDPVRLTVAGGDRLTLDAAGSCDPDGDRLRFRWWHYAEPSGVRGLAPLDLTDADTGRAVLVAPAAGERDIVYHIILEATDTGEPAITRYRRILLTVPAARSAVEAQ